MASVLQNENENIPPSLSGAVNIDMAKLESIFKAILTKLDVQGNKIASLEV